MRGFLSGPVNSAARYHYFQSLDFAGMGVDVAMRFVAHSTSITYVHRIPVLAQPMLT